MNHSEITSLPAASRLQFGDFRVDSSQRRIWHRDGTTVVLTPRLFDALLYFVERPGRLLDKDELVAALWPGLVVEENNLNQAVSALRRALGDDDQQRRYIQTVARRGFRFVADVLPLEDSNEGASALAALPADAADTASMTTAAPSRSRAMVLGVCLLVVVALLTWVSFKQSAGPDRDLQAITLGVLPFKPLVRQERDEVLELGMADNLIARLSSTRGIVVRSVGSVRRYDSKDADPLVAARELDVQWILDGTVQRQGERVRVTARLLRTADGTSAWSGSFDEPFTDVFTLQDTISERVAGVLAPHLSRRPQRSIAQTGTQSFEAYQFYLAGRLQLQANNPVALQRAIALFQRAIEADPKYALAYSSMANAYYRLPFCVGIAPVQAMEPARKAALRALELEPNSAEGNAALGWVTYLYDYDWKRAEHLFRQAIEANPSTMEAHFGLGHLLSVIGRGDEGFPHIQRARELDPLSLVSNTMEAGYLLARGRRDEGLQRLNLALEIDPDFWIAHLTMVGFHLADKAPDRALESLRLAEKYSGGATGVIADRGVLLAQIGRPAETRAVLDQLLTRQKSEYVSPAALADLYLALGDREAALDALDAAYASRDVSMVFLKAYGGLQLRNEPRFQALGRKMNLDLAAAPVKSAH